MNQGRRKSVFNGAAAIALACATGCVGVSAAPVIFVTTDFSTNDGQFTSSHTTDTATTKTSTNSLDGANFATATADAANGSVGIGMATTVAGTTGVSASAGAQITDVWTPCSATCLTTVNLAPVVYNMHFAGTLSPAWLAANAIDGDHIEFGGSFQVAGAGDSLEFAWNGTQMAGTFCNGGPTNATCAPFAFASTQLADGSLAFDDNVSFTGAVSGPGFTTLLALSADWDTTHQPSSLAFLHTFSFDIVSVDPNLGWVSDAGQAQQGGGQRGSGTGDAVPAQPGSAPLCTAGAPAAAPPPSARIIARPRGAGGRLPSGVAPSSKRHDAPRHGRNMLCASGFPEGAPVSTRQPHLRIARVGNADLHNDAGIASATDGETLLRNRGLDALSEALGRARDDTAWSRFWRGYVLQFKDLTLARAEWLQAENGFEHDDDALGLELSACGLVQCALLDNLSYATSPSRTACRPCRCRDLGRRRRSADALPCRRAPVARVGAA